jgi:hypothetical protein
MPHVTPTAGPAEGAAPPAAPAGGVDRLARRLTLAVVGMTLLVIVAGANVTSTKSGDAIPTWPWGWFTSDAGVAIEMSHRFVAGVLIASAAALAFAAHRTHDRAIRRVAWAAFAIVVFQAALGGVRVLVGAQDEGHGSLPFLKVVHATLGQAFFLLAVIAASLTSDWWRATKQRPLDDGGLAMLRAAGLALVTLLAQLVLGALGRHDVLVPREVHAVFALIPMILCARLVLVASWTCRATSSCSAGRRPRSASSRRSSSRSVSARTSSSRRPPTPRSARWPGS